MKQLKQLFLAFLFIIFFSSCEKEDNEEIYDCTCGVIANDGITNGCYWLEIRNDCSGNKRSFCFDQDVWMVNYVGDRFCVLNVQPW